MPTRSRENHAKRMLKNNHLVLCMRVNQLRTLGMRYLTGGPDITYILSAGRAAVKRRRELKIS